MKKRKPIVVWAARGTAQPSHVCFYKSKPILDCVWWTESKKGDFIISECPAMLKKVTGFSLKPGECKRVVIEIKVVK